jgi:hypothetical protein
MRLFLVLADRPGGDQADLILFVFPVPFAPGHHVLQKAAAFILHVSWHFFQEVLQVVVRIGAISLCCLDNTRRRAEGDTGFMEEMMPWSDAYREYERCKRKQQQSLFGQLFPRPDRPRAPRKKNVTTTREIVPESAGGGKEESA